MLNLLEVQKDGSGKYKLAVDYLNSKIKCWTKYTDQYSFCLKESRHTVYKICSFLVSLYYIVFANILMKLRGNCTPNPKSACFALYLKIVKTFFAKWCMHRKANCPGNLNGIGLLVGQAFFMVWIKTVKILFWSVTQEQLGLLRFLSSLDSLLYKMHTFSKRCWQFWDRAQNMFIFG